MDSKTRLALERRPLGIAGRLARAFIDSKLTPLVVLFALGLGGLAILVTPREEEPQIKVPMIDVFAGVPGRSAVEVERQIVAPLEKAFWSIPGVEYVYSTSSPDSALVVLRFRVGEDPDRAVTRVRAKLDSLADQWPAALPPPLVKPRSIDDVPIWAMTFWSTTLDPATLRQVAAEVENEIKTIPEVSDTALIGGLRRQFRVELDPAALAARGLAPGAVVPAIVAANRRARAGALVADGRELLVDAGGFVQSAEDLGAVVVAESGGRPVRLSDVARVLDGPEEPSAYVSHGEPGVPGRWPAVTLAVSKRRGANAITVVHAIERKLDVLRPKLLAADVRTTISRDYGETSSEKSNELLKHMGLATLSVALLMALALGRREAGVVLLAVPVTLALTLFVFWLFGYTLNRITLFALIFSIGILVDDAIVVVENIVRHLRLPGSRERGLAVIAVEATDEVGNPTVLATFAVIAAILPMGFVGGLMGPYMRPIPIGASAAMLFSLLVAFAVSPWAARLLFRRAPGAASGHGEGSGGTLARLYRKAMTPLVTAGGTRARLVFFAGIAVLLAAAMALVPLGAVHVKMLPFDNKNEFQVVVDFPDGTTLETTNRALSEMAEALRALPEVVGTEVYAGTAAPYNFNGLVRHYFLRSRPNQGDVQVTLRKKGDRRRSSHAVARLARPIVTAIGRRYDARVKVAEVPPGPPVLQTLVAEVYGPDEAGRREVARQVKDLFSRTEGVVDVDWYVESPRERVVFRLDRGKAGLSGIREADVAAALRLALSGDAVDEVQLPGIRERIPLVVTLPAASRNDLTALGGLTVPGRDGRLVPLSEIGRFERRPDETSIDHKNLKPVVYVTADVGGAKEAPVYAIAALEKGLSKIRVPGGYRISTQTATAPFDTTRYGIKWDGEWHVTYEVFRDLGLAFAAVLVLIYVLVVGWFRSFTVPLVIMAPIPLTLVGILPAHALFGVFFTATSMIGFIAGAGIIVRNSIILVDFIELRRREGMPLSEAVLDAGEVRFRPMLLTAAAVVVGTSVMLFDPIFQGLAVAMMAGEVAATLLSRAAVPVLYYLLRRSEEKKASAGQLPTPSSAPTPALEPERSLV
ncbi:MAG: efflux RND transporter permease subunit [Acidobacteriota bacterium]